MKKRLVTYFKNVFGTLLIVSLLGSIVLIALNGNFNYGHHDKRFDLDNEGPFVFHENDSLMSINFIKGNKNDGFYVDRKFFGKEITPETYSYFALEGSRFDFELHTEIKPPKSIYEDEQRIIAVSDIESGFRTFRDFLINNKVIDKQLEWTFGKGHLVLVGDFVDRGFSTTQVLWFIYKLEQEALKQGGQVHFILGNHEIKNLQDNFRKAAFKYHAVADILERPLSELYGPESFLGNWMSSKNTMEMINGHLFVHGGIHPEVAKTKLSLDVINALIRSKYRHPYYPRPDRTDTQLLIDIRKGPAWYRGYFNGELSEVDVNKGLDMFGAEAVIVGHTPQRKVSKLYDGLVFGIDVLHPKDYMDSFPFKASEGLLIQDGQYFRLLFDGTPIEL
ncbi:hypothetical protein D2V08_01560 [Flagellimonas lutimaris]|uniref:Calcineurin-like phosphoesterase domain-containing protein n=1 Tax=Flagellimonas lutimaris TaxID=475082 RepID=A0A3A1NB20_9FLAO|nr:metallophosphoesterase [Allomuricauda lutimaris]RIV36695.1 hypothetical protein D2V08_01560 [Allomuricauda lutimaris]